MLTWLLLVLSLPAWATDPARSDILEGVNLRNPDPRKSRLYVARSGVTRHFFVVTLYAEARQILTVNECGEVFDEIRDQPFPG